MTGAESPFLNKGCNKKFLKTAKIMKNEDHDKVKTASHEPRIEQGQIPCLIPVLSAADPTLIAHCFKPVPTRFPARQNQLTKRPQPQLDKHVQQVQVTIKNKLKSYA
jgi:hypothetical protein